MIRAVALLLVAAFISAVMWTAVTNPRRSLLVVVFLAPWTGLWVDIGQTFSAYQIALLALVATTFLRSLYPGWRATRIAAGGLLLLFVLYAVVNSMVQIGFLPEFETAGGGLRGATGRAIVQMMIFVFMVSPTVLVAWWVRRPADLALLVRTYISSVVVLALIGWWQLLVWAIIGHNPLPIEFVNNVVNGGDAVGEAVVAFGKLSLFRMSSFAGEPRNMGGAAVVAMLLIQAIAISQSAIPRFKLFGLWVFFALTVLATLSTTALLIWSLGSVVQVPAAWIFGVRLRVSGVRVLATLALVMAPFGIGIVAAESAGFPIIDLITARTIERIDANGAVEDFDLAIIAYLKDHPVAVLTGTGIGNAHIGAQRYLEPEFQWYALGNIFTAKAQYLRLISEVGIIGLVLVLFWYLVLVIDTAVALRRDPALPRMALPFAGSIVAIYLAAGQFGPEFAITAGALAGLCALARQPQRGIVRA